MERSVTDGKRRLAQMRTVIHTVDEPRLIISDTAKIKQHHADVEVQVLQVDTSLFARVNSRTPLESYMERSERFLQSTE